MQRRIANIEELAVVTGLSVNDLRHLRETAQGGEYDESAALASRVIRKKFNISLTLFALKLMEQALYQAGFTESMVEEWAGVV